MDQLSKPFTFIRVLWNAFVEMNKSTQCFRTTLPVKSWSTVSKCLSENSINYISTNIKVVGSLTISWLTYKRMRITFFFSILFQKKSGHFNLQSRFNVNLPKALAFAHFSWLSLKFLVKYFCAIWDFAVVAIKIHYMDHNNFLNFKLPEKKSQSLYQTPFSVILMSKRSFCDENSLSWSY